MITQPERWRRVDWQLRARGVTSHKRARRIFNELYREARALKILPRREPLADLDTILRLADALNRLGRTSRHA